MLIVFHIIISYIYLSSVLGPLNFSSFHRQKGAAVASEVC